MSTKVKTEPEEEVRPDTSGGDVQPEQQPKMVKEEMKETSDSEETLDSDEIDDEYLTHYCEMVDSIQPMTVSSSTLTAWLPETTRNYLPKTRSALIK